MTGRGKPAAAVAVIALFFLVRLALLVVREPFFDELWTVWLARQPFSHILAALRVDSGPPLYYFLARATNVYALRALSLLFATATLALILLRPSLGEGRWIAGALFAVYPPAALYGADARAYALCGLFVAAGVIAVREERPFAAAGAFLLAAYTHWYGALFLPLILWSGGRPGRRAFAAFAGAAVLFTPGLLLASRQPPEALAWIRTTNPLDVLGALAFLRPYGSNLLASPPVVLIVIAAVATLLAVARDFRFAPFVLVPVVLAMLFAMVGRTVYFPMRFEAVLAVPLILWISTSVVRWKRPVRIALVAVLLGCGAFTTVAGIVNHARRPPAPFDRAVTVLMSIVQPSDRIVASGYLYLHTIDALGTRRVAAYPAGQAVHPGWRVGQLTDEPLPKSGFMWIAERQAPELRLLRGRPYRVLYANELAVVLRVAPGR